jgi:hypothetical protein
MQDEFYYTKLGRAIERYNLEEIESLTMQERIEVLEFLLRSCLHPGIYDLPYSTPVAIFRYLKEPDDNI